MWEIDRFSTENQRFVIGEVRKERRTSIFVGFFLGPSKTSLSSFQPLFFEGSFCAIKGCGERSNRRTLEVY